LKHVYKVNMNDVHKRRDSVRTGVISPNLLAQGISRGTPHLSHISPDLGDTLAMDIRESLNVNVWSWVND
jgi:hypothetical protein